MRSILGIVYGPWVCRFSHTSTQCDSNRVILHTGRPSTKTLHDFLRSRLHHSRGFQHHDLIPPKCVLQLSKSLAISKSLHYVFESVVTAVLSTPQTGGWWQCLLWCLLCHTWVLAKHQSFPGPLLLGQLQLCASSKSGSDCFCVNTVC